MEAPGDKGSTVWGCSACRRGAWCLNRAAAVREAEAHATAHGWRLWKQTGPERDLGRDERVRELRATGLSLRAIGALVGISHKSVRDALTRERVAP